jgi:hypothetical protein
MWKGEKSVQLENSRLVLLPLPGNGARKAFWHFLAYTNYSASAQRPFVAFHQGSKNLDV